MNITCAMKIVTKPSWKNTSCSGKRQERGAEHDLRRRHGKEDEQVRRAATSEAVANDRNRDQRPECRRDTVESARPRASHDRILNA